jgi:SAM-dependent methyltransferase
VSRSRQKVSRPAESGELLPGVSVRLLQELHILTRDGQLNADSRRKLKQVNHLLGLLRPAVDDVLARFPEPVVVDCGAGKSYLGFLLAQTALGPAGKGRVINVDERPELIDRARVIATESGISNMEFVAADIGGAPIPERVHLVTALHACDTATDDALALALRHGADHIAVVPCCQAEVARQLKDSKPADPTIAELVAHPIHRREFGSHLTNVIRTLVLEANGYQVTVTELVGWEHSLKNELILARRVHRDNPAARARLDQLLQATGVRPKLLSL